MSKLVVKNLYFSYPKSNLTLGDINFTFDNEFLCIVGPSGAGKSTLLRLIAGLLTPLEGEVLLNDKNILAYKAHKRGISYVGQDFYLYPSYTIFQNLYFVAKKIKIKKDEAIKKVYEIANAVGISELLGFKPAELSIGQKQKVAIARAIIKNNQLVLLDEPFSNLDQHAKEGLMSLFRNVQKKYKMPFILITHDITFARPFIDKVMLIAEGRIISYNDPETFFLHPETLMAANFLYGDKFYAPKAIMNDEGFIVGNKKIQTSNAMLSTGTYLWGINLENHINNVYSLKGNRLGFNTTYQYVEGIIQKNNDSYLLCFLNIKFDLTSNYRDYMLDLTNVSKVIIKIPQAAFDSTNGYLIKGDVCYKDERFTILNCSNEKLILPNEKNFLDISKITILDADYNYLTVGINLHNIKYCKGNLSHKVTKDKAKILYSEQLGNKMLVVFSLGHFRHVAYTFADITTNLYEEDIFYENI